MQVSPDSKYIFTGGEDGILFIYAVSELMDHKTAIKGSFAALKAEKMVEQQEEGEDKLEVKYVEDDEEHYHHETMIDTQLADVVLLRKQKMAEMKRRQELLK